jgi:cell fate regulator YaaT (PSP1 superfamily)
MQPRIVGVRFQPSGKIYHFDASGLADVQVGDRVIVETARGRQVGEVVQFVADPPPPPEGRWKAIERRATPRDLLLHHLWQQRSVAALIQCRARAAELGLREIKIASAEFSSDGKRLTFFFCPESEEKVDLKSLRQDMQKEYPRVQIEMRQIGPRDVAKIMGGVGACGMEKRCCARFLTEFSPITVKMAKEQGISLTPPEITGICGRLRCCLLYEYEWYAAARQQLPKKGKRVVTPYGEGKVVEVFPLRMSVRVALPNIGEREFHRDQLEPWDEAEALRRQSSAPPCQDCPHTTTS